jgi:hypothetical protein
MRSSETDNPGDVGNLLGDSSGDKSSDDQGLLEMRSLPATIPPGTALSMRSSETDNPGDVGNLLGDSSGDKSSDDQGLLEMRSLPATIPPWTALSSMEDAV